MPFYNPQYGLRVFASGWPSFVSSNGFDVTFKIKLPQLEQKTFIFNNAVTSTTERLDVAILIDDSYSMRQTDPERMRVSAVKLFSQIAAARGSTKSLAIISFNRSAHLLLPPTAPAKIESINDALGKLVARGGTDMDSAFLLAYNVLATRDSHRKIAIVLSDGKDQPGKYEDSHRIFSSAKWPVYTVGLSSLADTNVLRRIADETGGQYRFAANHSEIESAFLEIVHTLHRQVIIGHWVLPVKNQLKIPVDDTVKILTLNSDRRFIESDLNVVMPEGRQYLFEPEQKSRSILDIYSPERGLWGVTTDQQSITVKAEAESDLKLINLLPQNAVFTNNAPIYLQAILIRDAIPISNAVVVAQWDEDRQTELLHVSNGIYEAWLKTKDRSGNAVLKLSAEGKTDAGYPFRRELLQTYLIKDALRNNSKVYIPTESESRTLAAYELIALPFAFSDQELASQHALNQIDPIISLAADKIKTCDSSAETAQPIYDETYNSNIVVNVNDSTTLAAGTDSNSAIVEAVKSAENNGRNRIRLLIAIVLLLLTLGALILLFYKAKIHEMWKFYALSIVLHLLFFISGLNFMLQTRLITLDQVSPTLALKLVTFEKKSIFKSLDSITGILIKDELTDVAVAQKNTTMGDKYTHKPTAPATPLEIHETTEFTITPIIESLMPVQENVESLEKKIITAAAKTDDFMASVPVKTATKKMSRPQEAVDVTKMLISSDLSDVAKKNNSLPDMTIKHETSSGAVREILNDIDRGDFKNIEVGGETLKQYMTEMLAMSSFESATVESIPQKKEATARMEIREPARTKLNRLVKNPDGNSQTSGESKQQALPIRSDENVSDIKQRMPDNISLGQLFDMPEMAHADNKMSTKKSLKNDSGVGQSSHYTGFTQHKKISENTLHQSISPEAVALNMANFNLATSNMEYRPLDIKSSALPTLNETQLELSVDAYSNESFTALPLDSEMRKHFSAQSVFHQLDDKLEFAQHKDTSTNNAIAQNVRAENVKLNRKKVAPDETLKDAKPLTSVALSQPQILDTPLSGDIQAPVLNVATAIISHNSIKTISKDLTKQHAGLEIIQVGENEGLNFDFKNSNTIVVADSMVANVAIEMQRSSVAVSAGNGAKSKLDNLISEPFSISKNSNASIDFDAMSLEAPEVAMQKTGISGEFGMHSMNENFGSASVLIGLVQYGGDWDCSRSAMMFLSHQLRERTGMALMANDRVIKLNSPDLSNMPFVYITGHRDFVFSESEIKSLRSYLLNGGSLWADDSTHYRDETFDKAFRREIAKVLPGSQIIKLDASFKGFSTGYDLSNGYKGFAIPPGDKYRLDYLEGILIGDRVAVVYSRNDYGDGLNIDPLTQPLEPSLTNLSPLEMQEGSIRMGINLVLYFLLQRKSIDDNFAQKTGRIINNKTNDSEIKTPKGVLRKWDYFSRGANIIAEEWSDPATWNWQTDEVFSIDFKVNDKDKVALSQTFEPVLRIDKNDVFTFEINSKLSCGARVALGINFRDRYFETAPQYCKPGVNKFYFHCDSSDFKTAESKWMFTSDMPLPDFSDKIIFIIYSPAGGTIEFSKATILKKD